MHNPIALRHLGVIRRGLPLLVLALLTSCGDPGGRRGSGIEPRTPSTTYDGTWELVEGRSSEGPIEISDRWRITLTIAGKRFGGLSACNHYGASARVQGNTISISGIGGTEMGCHPDVMETEERYNAALLAAETIQRREDNLTITGADAELVFGFVPPPPTARLIEVRWELESLIHGRGPDATASSAHPAHLYFDRNGTFQGFTGCSAIEGEWIEEADRVTFTYFGAKDGGCSGDLKEQNDEIINLGDGFTFDIEGQTLTLRGRFSETWLQYRAASPE